MKIEIPEIVLDEYPIHSVKRYKKPSLDWWKFLHAGSQHAEKVIVTRMKV